jgi:hypothetical protein
VFRVDMGIDFKHMFTVPVELIVVSSNIGVSWRAIIHGFAIELSITQHSKARNSLDNVGHARVGVNVLALPPSHEVAHRGVNIDA